MRPSLSSSILLFMLGCAPASYRDVVVVERRALNIEERAQMRPPVYSDASFIASVDAFDHHLSGIMLVQQVDEATYRIGFVNQLGMSLFVFDISRDRFHMISCIEQLNNTPMIDLVQKDIRLLLFRDDRADTVDVCADPRRAGRIFASGSDDDRMYCFVDSTSNLLTWIETASRGERLARFEFSDHVTRAPASIVITHHDVPVRIHLTLLGEEN